MSFRPSLVAGQQNGRIRVLQNGVLQEQDFLGMRVTILAELRADRVSTCGALNEELIAIR